MKSAQNQKDKFELLCCIKADLSAAPYTYRYSTQTMNMCYKREYDVIFLVSLAELKAQVSWVATWVRVHRSTRAIYLTQLPRT